MGELDVRLVEVAVPAAGDEPWVGTYWTRDGYPDPEATLLPDRQTALDWVREPVGGVMPFAFHETAWFAGATFERRGEEDYAVVHLGKVVGCDLQEPVVAAPPLLYGFEVSRGLIPQGPVLFETEADRDDAVREVLEGEIRHSDWRCLVAATAEGNYVERDLPPHWKEAWDTRTALEWLIGFSFVGDGDDFEVRTFETAAEKR